MPLTTRTRFSQGSIEFADAALAVTGVSLRDGEFVITARGLGPVPAYCGPFRIYGPDGVLVLTGGKLTCPRARTHDPVTVTVTCRPGSVVGEEL